ncbi:hypothetical protein BDV93DRAFT_574716 [Ceratobasidium sp. AG-I]|nr:hypothetical protein BDV93DRAFT_574716 [Ceratobasidium sp. AG-I]
MSDLELTYFVLGDSPNNIHCLQIEGAAAIWTLLNKIQEDYKTSTGGSRLVNSKLYKIDKPVDDLAHVEIPPGILMPRSRVNVHWPEATDPNHVQVLVVAEANILPVEVQKAIEARDTVGNLATGVERLHIAQDILVKSIRTAKSPSESAKLSAFIEQQTMQKGKIAILDGRPFNNTGLPIQLYHDVFERFTNGINGAETLSPSVYAMTERFLENAQAIYPREEDRHGIAFQDFEECFDIAFVKEEVEKCKADGVIKAAKQGVKAYCAILELKNEIGIGSSDPSVQASQAYAKYWSERQKRDLRMICCCPSLIITIAGPWMCILGAVYLDRVVVQPLTEFLWLGRHPWSNQRLDQLARVFHSLADSVKHLDTYYQTLSSAISVDPARFFPYHRHYTDENGKVVHFTYEESLLPQEQRLRALFKARTSDGKELVVKFVQTYCMRAHQLLADKRLAPKLLFDSGKQLSAAGDRMIVMEYVPSTDLHDFLRLDTTHPGSVELEMVRQDVENALDILHKENLVFGDLRAPNVVVVKRGDRTRGMLVDFDWSGTEGEARYPFGMNEVSIQWPEGVRKGALLRKVHDREMFKQLLVKENHRSVGLS